MATASTPTQAPAQTTAPAHVQPPCWPDEPGWRGGATEIFLSTRHLTARWDAVILDDDQNPYDSIIEGDRAFTVRFRVQLEGRLWRCIRGHWCFDLGFTSIGDGSHFNLSDVLPDPLKQKLRLCDWEGCQNRCVEVCIEIPPGTIPKQNCGTLFEIGAKFELHCCGDCDGTDRCGKLALAGHKPLGEYMFV